MIEHRLPRLLLSALASRGPKNPLSVFIFHRVLPARDPLFPSEPVAAEFETLVGWIKDWFNVLPLAEAVERLQRGSLPARPASITFDDGYADNVTVALPILARLEVPATFFIATGFLDGGRMWNDTLIESVRRTARASLDLGELGLGVLPVQTLEQKRHAVTAVISALKHRVPEGREQAVSRVAELAAADLPGDLMMTTDQLRRLHGAAGMSIGAHTVTHPILARCDDAAAKREIAESRDHLAGVLNDRIPLFAYPNGKLGKDYTTTHARIVKSLGFTAAVSTNPGASRQGDDLFQLRRFTPWDRTPLRFALRSAQNLMRKPTPATP